MSLVRMKFCFPSFPAKTFSRWQLYLFAKAVAHLEIQSHDDARLSDSRDWEQKCNSLQRL